MSILQLFIVFSVLLYFALTFSALALFASSSATEGHEADSQTEPVWDPQGTLRAYVACAGMSSSAPIHRYSGIADCRVAVTPYGGDRECRDGCLGYGTCIGLCPRGSIARGPEGRIVVGEDCDGCGVCVSVCPTGVMKLAPRNEEPLALCNTALAASRARSFCRFAPDSARQDKNAFHAGDNGLELLDRKDRTAES